jgi:hypothetical protein
VDFATPGNIVRGPEVASLYVQGLQNALQDARDTVRFNDAEKLL